MAGTTNEKKKDVQSDAVTQAQHTVQKPVQYQSQYQQQMNDILGQIQNQGKFQYDINADALYQQAAQRYLQQGQQAMMDTMGQASALTGGYGNSYAQNAGQQAYQGYLQGLTDLVPQYRQMALDQYQMEGDDLLSKYSLLASQEESEYQRYMDQVSRYQQEWDNALSLYRLGKRTPEILEILGLPQVKTGGGGSGGSGGPGSSGYSGGNVSLVSEATWIAENYGQDAAMDYIRDQTGGTVSAESNNAQANVKGVSQTEYYKKMMEYLNKKKGK